MHRSLAHPALRAVRIGWGSGAGRTKPGNGRAAMTAPLKHSDPITVDVGLGDRSYDIIIGRGVLDRLGQRIAALRPGVRTAVVTDRTVASHWLAPAEASLREAG